MKYSHKQHRTGIKEPPPGRRFEIAIGAFLAVFVLCYFVCPTWSGNKGEGLEALRLKKAEFDETAEAKSRAFTSLMASGSSEEALYSAMQEWERAKENSVLINARLSHLIDQNELGTEVGQSSAASPLIRFFGSFVVAIFVCGSVLVLLPLKSQPNRPTGSMAGTLIDPKVAGNHSGVRTSKRKQVAKAEVAKVK